MQWFPLPDAGRGSVAHVMGRWPANTSSDTVHRSLTIRTIGELCFILDRAQRQGDLARVVAGNKTEEARECAHEAIRLVSDSAIEGRTGNAER